MYISPSLQSELAKTKQKERKKEKAVDMDKNDKWKFWW